MVHVPLSCRPILAGRHLKELKVPSNENCFWVMSGFLSTGHGFVIVAANDRILLYTLAILTEKRTVFSGFTTIYGVKSTLNAENVYVPLVLVAIGTR
jgi:hypothetical protein